MKLGELLKEAREQQQITLQEVEQKTKIRSTYLKAIEDDNYELLPGRIYVLGFLKSYARFLGLDADEIVETYKSKYPKNNEENISEPSPKEEISSNKDFSKKKYYLIAVIALAAIMALIYFQPDSDYNQPAPIVDNGAEQETPADDPQDEIEPEGQIEPPEQPPLEPAFPVYVSVEIVDRPCWIQVTVDGTEVFAGIKNPGVVEQYHGNQEVRMRFGDAGAAKVIYNGEDLGFMGERGQVVTKTFIPTAN